MRSTDIGTDRVRLSVAAARDLSERAMRGIGYAAGEARILADHVVDAALCGYEYSGLPKLLNVAEHPRIKAPRSPLKLVVETSVSALYGGGNQNGMIAMYHATVAVIERAKAHGLAIVGVMGGRNAYYVEMAARAGLIGIHTVSAPPMVAPLGGARAVASGSWAAGVRVWHLMSQDRGHEGGRPLPEGAAGDNVDYARCWASPTPERTSPSSRGRPDQPAARPLSARAPGPSLETAVRLITAAPAEIFGIPDRGRLAPGLAADITVFDPDTIACHEEELVNDMPDGGPATSLARAVSDGLLSTASRSSVTAACPSRTRCQGRDESSARRRSSPACSKVPAWIARPR